MLQEYSRNAGMNLRMLAIALLLMLVQLSTLTLATSYQVHANKNCSFYIAPSKVNGIGVFAGESSAFIKQYSLFREDITIPYMQNESYDWSINYYAYYGHSNGYAHVEFGLGSLFNHANTNIDIKHYNPNYNGFMLFGNCCIGLIVLIVLSMIFPREKSLFVMFMDRVDDKDTFILIYSIIVPLLIAMIALISLGSLVRTPNSLLPAAVKFQLQSRSLRPGQEVFSNYGNNWFSDKKIQVLPTINADYELHDLQEIGVCATNLQVHSSGVSKGGKGTFANRIFKKGDVIEVTPLLALPKTQVHAANSFLINYCYSVNGSDIALLPLTTAAIANHGGGHANMKIEWYTWDHTINTHKDAFFKQPHELLLSKSAELFFLYRAIKDISIGEEVTLDYGADYEALVDKRNHRGAINLPRKMFPEHWFGECVERLCANA